MDNHPTKQKPIPYGFKDIAGNAWPDAWVDAYNRLTEIINSFSQNCSDREFYLDQRHRQYVQYLELKKNAAQKS